MTKNIPVTVIISVKNEEINLPKCLEKLYKFSEVIIVDSNSTDKTTQIAKSYNYKIVNFNWNGRFPKKRNWALENIKIINDWVLFLDADEFLTDKFVNEIFDKTRSTKHVGFWLTYNNFFMGKEIKFGDKMSKLALFKKECGRYERIDEDYWSHLDMEIHEHPILSGSVGKINSPIFHKDYKGLSHYIQRHNAYSSWEAHRFLSIKKSKINSLNFRQKLKYILMDFGLLPWVYFFGTFFIKFGFLDGVAGFRLAIYKSNYFFQIQTKVIELKKKL